MTRTLGAGVALALCAAGCASSKDAARAQELETSNEALAVEVRRQDAELQKSYQTMAEAERAAGLGVLGCMGVSPARAPVPDLPRSGAIHAQFQLRGQPYRMSITYAAPRQVAGWLESQGTCKVGR